MGGKGQEEVTPELRPEDREDVREAVAVQESGQRGRRYGGNTLWAVFGVPCIWLDTSPKVGKADCCGGQEPMDD